MSLRSPRLLALLRTILLTEAKQSPDYTARLRPQSVVLWLQRSRMFIETGSEQTRAPAERNVSADGSKVCLPFRSAGAKRNLLASRLYKHLAPLEPEHYFCLRPAPRCVICG